MNSRRNFLKQAAIAPAVTVAATTLVPGTEAILDAGEPGDDVALAPVPTAPTTVDALKAKHQVAAKISPRLLTKAARFFSGSVEGRMHELLQNARRAGAKNVWITCDEVDKEKDEYRITMRDDGHGVEDFGQLLALGHSGWDDGIEAAEDPAGAGFFCLSPREVLAASRGKEINLTEPGWVGMPVDVEKSTRKHKGLYLEFIDEQWTQYMLEGCVIYTGMHVRYNGTMLESKPFIDPSKPVLHLPELGCKVQLFVHTDTYHPRLNSYDSYSVVNFHGQTLRAYELRPEILSALKLRAVVDMTGEPTALRLVLPDRNRMFANEALEQLKLEIEKYAFGRVPPEHDLSFDNYKRGRAIGFNLPEAVERWRGNVACWPGDDNDNIDLGCGSRKVRLGTGCSEVEGINLVLLAAYADQCDFMPVAPDNTMIGYSWVKKPPRVTKMKLYKRKELAEQHVSCGHITVVEDLKMRVTLNDGSKPQLFPIPLARLDDNGHVIMTARALFHGDHDTELMSMLGGYSHDSEQSYDEFSEEFNDDLNKLRCDLKGPQEHARAEVMTAAAEFADELGFAKRETKPKWKSVTVHVDGTVVLIAEDGTEHKVEPAAAKF